jgi:hypothetical protein
MKRPILFLTKSLVLLSIFGLGVSGIYAATGLYADGSLYLFKILTLVGYWDFHSSRAYAQIITQTPVVAAITLGVTNLNLLIRMHSFGLIAIPLGFWISAFLLHIRSNFFWLLALAFAVSYLSSGFMSVAEYNITYAMAAFSASLLFRRDIGLKGAGVLVGTSIALTRSYEAMVFIGPLLCSIAIFRATKEKHLSVIVRIALIAAGFLLAVASAISAWSIMFPRDPANLAAAGDISMIIRILRSHHFIYLIVMSALAFVVYINDRPLITKAVASIAVIVSIAFVASPHSWNVPGRHYEFRSISGLMLFCTLFAAELVYLYRKTARKKGDEHVISAGYVITALVITLSIPFYIKTFGFYDWARKFESEAQNQTGPVPIDETGIYLGEFYWDWTNPPLSILLRGNSTGIILNSRKYKGWQPFDLEKLPINPLGAFEKSSKLYR